MPRRQPLLRRWLTAATWPVGVALTSWDYMWRSTPLHRSETSAVKPGDGVALLSYPTAVTTDEVLREGDGSGPLFHRCYRVLIREADVGPEALMEQLRRNLNQAAPTGFARFHKLLGDGEKLEPGDEYVVRMPGPWDGPVRVLDVTPRSFRLATLEGHLEAGQIEFRAADAENGRLQFEIESWARSSGRLIDFLYHRLRMAKEIQAHMWISFLEGVVELAGGVMTGGITIETERITEPDD